MFSYFGGPLCGFPSFSVGLTLVAVIVMVALSMTSLGRGLLVGATIAIYATWLAASALSSNPQMECNPMASMSHSGWSTWAGIAFAAVSIGYAGWSAATGA